MSFEPIYYPIGNIYCFFANEYNGHIPYSHHHQVAILVPDDKIDCFCQLEIFYSIKNGLAFIRDMCSHLELMASHSLTPKAGLALGDEQYNEELDCW